MNNDVDFYRPERTGSSCSLLQRTMGVRDGVGLGLLANAGGFGLFDSGLVGLCDGVDDAGEASHGDG